MRLSKEKGSRISDTHLDMRQGNAREALIAVTRDWNTGNESERGEKKVLYPDFR